MKRFLCIISTLILMCGVYTVSFAGGYDERIPKPTDVVLSSSGDITWNIENVTSDPYTGVVYQLIYKKFEIQLMKRYYNQVSNTYEYKDNGSTRTVTIESDDSSYEAHIDINSAGYYKAKVRAYIVEGNYGPWSEVYDDDSDAAAFDEENVLKIDLNNGTQANYVYGPGTVDYANSLSGNMMVQSPFNNALGQQYSNVIYGTGGTYVNSGAYYPANIYQNGQLYNSQTQNMYQNATVGVGPANGNSTASQYAINQTTPGFINESSLTLTPSSAMVVSSMPLENLVQNTANIIQGGPNIEGHSVGTAVSSNNSSSGGPGSMQAQTSFSTEAGWHGDNYGRYYYVSNGTTLKNQWYLIGDSYYRFDENGYMISGRWFKDPANQGWYYLNDDGKMATGWKLTGGYWYYLCPLKGAYYGIMYANCSIPVDGKFYAFNELGACLMNTWYDGHYYGADGARQN